MKNYEKELRKAEKNYQQRDFKSAYESYLSLAENSHVESQVFIGWMIVNGIGIEADSKAAGVWFKRAALLGSAQGAFYYGRFLTQHSKHKEALEFYYMAANKGYSPAIFRLGYSFIKGKGSPVNIPKGYKYLLSAMACGHIFALREVAILDLKGNRGLINRMKGLWLLIYAICLGFVISILDRYSERLRA